MNEPSSALSLLKEKLKSKLPTIGEFPTKLESPTVTANSLSGIVDNDGFRFFKHMNNIHTSGTEQVDNRKRALDTNGLQL